MKWYELSLATDFAASDMLQTMLLECGAGGVEIDDPALLNALEGQWVEADEPLPTVVLPPDRRVAVKAYFHEDPGLDDLLDDIRGKVLDLVSSGLIPDTETHVREVSEDDWATAWKQYFNPLLIGKGIWIIPSWREGDPIDGEPGGGDGSIRVILDPGMAFGTGNHPTTALCLELLEECAVPGQTFADIGTGSGILAIAAAKLGLRGKAVDIDSLAVGVAKDNLVANGIGDMVDCHCGDITDPDQRVAMGLEARGYDLILANIVPEVIVRLLPDMVGLMADGGRMLLSGIIEDKAGSVTEALDSAGLRVDDVKGSGEWRAILASRP